MKCKHLIFLAVALPLLSSCSTRPVITASDESKVLELTVKKIEEKFGKYNCIVKSMHDDFLFIPNEKPDTKWIDNGMFKYRLLKKSDMRQVPQSALIGTASTSSDFGCKQTVTIEKPAFYEFEEHNKKSIVASINIDKMCGPVCGQRFGLTLTKKSDSWQSSPEGLTPTGLSF